MYLIATLLPLVTAILVGLFGRFIGYRGVQVFSTCMLFLCNLLIIYIFILVFQTNNFNFIKIGMWVHSNLLVINWGFYFDSVACVILVIILTISSLVHLYSCEYIKNDPHFIRFLIKLSFFTFFIVILVTADNFLQLFLGWEGVGFCSYLLINFWYTRLQANKAAIKAIIINRIGDIGLLLSICLIVYKFQSLDFLLIINIVPYFIYDSIYFFNIKMHYLTLVNLFLLVGIIGKSAQFGLHTWLPDAIEGPTPVSALLHAATIVTAGIFLFIRCSFLFEYTISILSFSSFLGLLTAFFAATCAIVQNDIKKIIAYSTCSQLGYIIFICGLSQYSVGLFHLFNHAFFKALLFLSAGVIIHALVDNQDLRKIGIIKILLPLIFVIILVGNLALLGFPFLTGFYSKDLIFELSFLTQFFISNSIIIWVALITTALTACYSIRLIYFVFLVKNNIFKLFTIHFHYPNIIILVPLFILFFCSIFIGYFFKELFIGVGSNFFNISIFVLPEHYILTYTEFIPFYIKLLPLFFTIFGILTFYFLDNLIFSKYIFKIFFFRWYIDKLYNFISKLFIVFSYEYIYILLDKGFIEKLGPFGFSVFFIKLNRFVTFFNTGYIFSSICFISLFFIFIYSIILFSI
jgi:NADH-ubiquinone oxidoreductase chain 5